MVGGVSYNVTYLWDFVGLTYVVSVGLTTLEILWIRFFTIVVLKRMLPLLDDFFGMFFQLANLAVGAFLAIVSAYSEDSYPRNKGGVGLPRFVPIMSKPKNFKPRYQILQNMSLTFTDRQVNL